MPLPPSLQTIVSPGKAYSAPVIANFNTLYTYLHDYALFKDVASQTVSVAVTFSAGITVSASGITVTGNSTITGTLGGLTGLTVASGDLTVTSGNAVLTAGNLTLTAGNLVLTSGNLTLADGQAAGTYFDAGDSGTSLTIDWNAGNWQRVRLTGNCTLTLSNPVAGAHYRLDLLQDTTGTRTVTWPGTVKHDNGTTPTLTTTVSRKDSFNLSWNGAAYVTSIISLNVSDTT